MNLQEFTLSGLELSRDHRGWLEHHVPYVEHPQQLLWWGGARREQMLSDSWNIQRAQYVLSCLYFIKTYLTSQDNPKCCTTKLRAVSRGRKGHVKWAQGGVFQCIHSCTVADSGFTEQTGLAALIKATSTVLIKAGENVSLSPLWPRFSLAHTCGSQDHFLNI